MFLGSIVADRRFLKRQNSYILRKKDELTEHDLLYISCIAVSTTYLNAYIIHLLSSTNASHNFCNANTIMTVENLDLVQQIAMPYQVNYGLIDSSAVLRMPLLDWPGGGRGSPNVCT